MKKDSLNLVQSIPYFLFPGLLMVIGFYILMPFFINIGINDYYSYLLGIGIPLFVLLIASIIAYKLEGNPMNLKSFNERFRLKPLKLKDILIGLGILSISLGLFFLVSQFSVLLVQKGIIKIPVLPDVANGSFGLEAIEEAVGGLKGNWLVLIFTIFILIINILGEEFWWRGFILPKQEKAFGVWVILIHGILWTLFHFFKYWDLLNLIPICIGLTLAVYLTKKTSVSIMMHFITNGSILIVTLLIKIIGG